MKETKLKDNSQKGASLYIVIVITSILLAMTLGLETLLVSQLKGLREMGHSTIALFGADSGMEKVLYLDAICQKEEHCSDDLCAYQRQRAYDDNFISTTTCTTTASGTTLIGLYDYSTSSSAGEFSITGLSYEANVTTTGGISTTTYFYSKGIFKKSQREIEASRTQ